jgi:GTP-dependent phosphoenolpyruvate carboxykinase
MTGLRIPRENIKKLFAVNKNDWKRETEDIGRFFKTFGKDLPREMGKELKSLGKRLAA